MIRRIVDISSSVYIEVIGHTIPMRIQTLFEQCCRGSAVRLDEFSVSVRHQVQNIGFILDCDIGSTCLPGGVQAISRRSPDTARPGIEGPGRVRCWLVCVTYLQKHPKEPLPVLVIVWNISLPLSKRARSQEALQFCHPRFLRRAQPCRKAALFHLCPA